MNACTMDVFDGRPVTAEDILQAVESLKAIPQNKEWVIVDPEGRIFIGEYEKVAPYFMSRHPMLAQTFKPLRMQIEGESCP